jgi:uncharacterized protein YbjT (DUF2867 family)
MHEALSRIAVARLHAQHGFMNEYLIIGGTGKTGRRIARRLTQSGLSTRVASRTPSGPGAVWFDWNAPASWDVALQGSSAVWIVAPAFEVDHADRVAALIARAETLGVTRAVFCSARGVDHVPDGGLARSEAALRHSGLEWTIVRPAWFAQNFTEAFPRHTIDQDSVVVAPSGNGRVPFVDAEDIAAVAVAALTGTGHAGEIYDVSGPEAITFADAAAELSRVAGRAIRHVDPGLETWHAGLIGAGVPGDYAALLTEVMAVIRQGGDSHVSDGVQRATGRAPTSFSAWAARDAAVLARAA